MPDIRKRKAQDNPLVKVTAARDESTYLDALKRSRHTEDPTFWEESARETARRFGVNENLQPKDRCLAIAGAIGVRLPMREPGCDDE